MWSKISYKSSNNINDNDVHEKSATIHKSLKSPSQIIVKISIYFL